MRLIDKVLGMLEADERFVFTLDGQLQTVDDYLEVRPENEARIRALVERGRLAVGPWQVLMDEFLVSGETMWRNLERGLARGDELGGAMRVGYLPDMFGHCAQMPQLLRAFGLETAVVWRGVPSVVDRHVFAWAGLDGSMVRAEYLPYGYGNGAYLVAAPEGLAGAVDDLVEAMRPWFGDDPVLAMYGTDHMEPVAELVELVERCNSGRGTDVRIKTLAAAVGSGPLRGTDPEVRGEMRSGARANVLMGVASARMDIKAAAARAERALERYAEPFAALHADAWPAEFLDLAWRRVIENSAHDSICGCSADAVSAQVLVRYAEAEQLGRDLAVEALAPAAAATPRGAFVVANPSPFARTDLVELDVAVPEDEELPETQELERNVPELNRIRIPGREILELLDRRLHGRELFGRWLNAFRVEDGPRLVLELDTEQDPPWLDVVRLRQEIAIAADARADEEWDVIFFMRPRRKLLAAVTAPPLGWAAARVGWGQSPRGQTPVTSGRGWVENGLVRFELSELGRIVRGFDVGDSYNYAPPADDVLVDEPDSTSVDVLESGPLRARLRVSRTYSWAPGHVVPIETLVELRAGEPFVRVRIALDNPAVDQRVRVHVPLPRSADRSYAEGQYAVVERGRESEGGYGEVPLPTFPASAFVAAGGLAVLLDHVTEYELLDGELALTVLRSTGWISRNENPYRQDPAGPEVPLPAAQMRGPWSYSFALYRYDGERPGPDVLEQAERFRLPFLVLPGAGDVGDLTARDGLSIEGEGVVLAALRRVGGALEVRVVNQSDERRSATVAGKPVELRPWEIRTLS